MSCRHTNVPGSYSLAAEVCACLPAGAPACALRGPAAAAAGVPAGRVQQVPARRPGRQQQRASGRDVCVPHTVHALLQVRQCVGVLGRLGCSEAAFTHQVHRHALGARACVCTASQWLVKLVLFDQLCWVSSPQVCVGLRHALSLCDGCCACAVAGAASWGTALPWCCRAC